MMGMMMLEELMLEVIGEDGFVRWRLKGVVVVVCGMGVEHDSGASSFLFQRWLFRLFRSRFRSGFPSSTDMSDVRASVSYTTLTNTKNQQTLRMSSVQTRALTESRYVPLLPTPRTRLPDQAQAPKLLLPTSMARDRCPHRFARIDFCRQRRWAR